MKRGVNKLPAIKQLVDLESSERIIYSIVSNEESFIPKESEIETISHLASLCNGSPPVINIMEQAILNLKVSMLHEKLSKDLVQNNVKVSRYSKLTLHIPEILDSFQLSPQSRLLLHCLSSFHKVPIPKNLLVALENEVTASTSPYSSCIAELQQHNCLVFYPSPIIIQSSSDRSSSLNMTLYTVPDIISESVWRKMKRFDRLVGISIACKVIKTKGLELYDYMHGLMTQLKSNYYQIVSSSRVNSDTSCMSVTGSDDFLMDAEDSEMYQQMKEKCLLELDSLWELSS